MAPVPAPPFIAPVFYKLGNNAVHVVSFPDNLVWRVPLAIVLFIAYRRLKQSVKHNAELEAEQNRMALQRKEYSPRPRYRSKAPDAPSK